MEEENPSDLDPPDYHSEDPEVPEICERPTESSATGVQNFADLTAREVANQAFLGVQAMEKVVFPYMAKFEQVVPEIKGTLLVLQRENENFLKNQEIHMKEIQSLRNSCEELVAWMRSAGAEFQTQKLLIRSVEERMEKGGRDISTLSTLVQNTNAECLAQKLQIHSVEERVERGAREAMLLSAHGSEGAQNVQSLGTEVISQRQTMDSFRLGM
eukprot:EG_transcript_22743